MRSARRQSIVIVGGGLAGLAAAFELTKPGRYPGADVTVYQMGWRLGGKCSSGRDQQGRIIEHGLHMWFGYYENAFRLLREVYEEWKPGANWRDVLKPQDFTPIGDTHGIDGGSFIPVHWPPRGGVPGDGRRASIWQGLVGVLELLAGFHEIMAREGDLTFAQAIVRIRPEAAQHFERFNRPIDAANELNLSAALQIALRWASDIESSAMTAADARGLKSLLRETTVVMLRHRHTVGDELLAQLSDIVVAFVCGVIDDVILERLEITQLDQLDFREWLILHGAHFDSAWQSSFVKALYDTMFQYVEGDISCPSYGAGTAAQVVLRMLGTYKSHAVWE